MLYVKHRHTREVREIPEGETTASRADALRREGELRALTDSSGRRLWVPTSEHDPDVTNEQRRAA